MLTICYWQMELWEREMQRVKRNSSFELLRIIAMILIVGSHIVGHTVFLSYGGSDMIYSNFAGGGYLDRTIASIFAPGGDMGNWIFFLLMGYFYSFANSPEDKMKKLSRLTIQVYFYVGISVLIFAIPYVSGLYRYEELGIPGIIKTLASMILPVTSECWWFITTYVFVFVILGALLFIDELTKKQFSKLLGIFFLINICRLNSGSYNKIFSCGFVVLVGIYIRKYTDIGKLKRIRGCMLVIIIVSWILSIFTTLFFYRYSTTDAAFVVRCISRLSNIASTYLKMIFAICMLLLFSTIKLKSNRIINRLSSCTFGIYLFHGSPFFIYFFFKHLNVLTEAYEAGYFAIAMVTAEALIFTGGALLDMMQKRLNSWASRRFPGALRQ